LNFSDERQSSKAFDRASSTNDLESPLGVNRAATRTEESKTAFIMLLVEPSGDFFPQFAFRGFVRQSILLLPEESFMSLCDALKK